MSAKNTAFFRAALFFLALGTLAGPAAALEKPEKADRRALVYWPGTPRQLEVFQIFGRETGGPTVMILGGIQGDEPGGFLSADLYADVTLKRGNLIVVPRANFSSIVRFDRGLEGDMNRKFQGELSAGDPDREAVELIKSLIRESDLFLNLHDGSGYYRPTYESETANPNRYGQSLIADAEAYTHEPSGRLIPLAEYAEEVINRVNREIGEPLHLFRFFNTDTAAADSPYKEQRRSATFYALTQVGIPAFGIETSKQLPSLEMKVHQHNLAVTAFLDLFGVEMDRPSLRLPPPRLGYVLITVGRGAPLAAADGQTLFIPKGESLKVEELAANYDRGLSVFLEGPGERTDLTKPFSIDGPAVLVVRKDHTVLGRINLALQPPGEAGVRLSPPATLRSARTSEPAEWPDAAAGAAAAAAVSPARSLIEGFMLEVDGRPLELAPGGTLEVLAGTLVKMADLHGEAPPGTVMNLRGFVPKEKAAANDGEDRGFTADTAVDMMPAFSSGGLGQEYAINAEQGKTVLASAVLKIVRPRLESATLSLGGEAKTVKPGERLSLPAGAEVILTEVKLAGGLVLTNPRYALGGRPLPADLPQTLTLPSFAVNLAVFNGEALAGKVTLAPR